MTRLDPPKKSSLIPWRAKKKKTHLTPSKPTQIFVYHQPEPTQLDQPRHFLTPIDPTCKPWQAKRADNIHCDVPNSLDSDHFNFIRVCESPINTDNTSAAGQAKPDIELSSFHYESNSSRSDSPDITVFRYSPPQSAHIMDTWHVPTADWPKTSNRSLDANSGLDEGTPSQIPQPDSGFQLDTISRTTADTPTNLPATSSHQHEASVTGSHSKQHLPHTKTPSTRKRSYTRRFRYARRQARIKTKTTKKPERTIAPTTPTLNSTLITYLKTKYSRATLSVTRQRRYLRKRIRREHRENDLIP